MEELAPRNAPLSRSAGRPGLAVKSLARAVALLAMFVQALFFADHIGAMAAKTFGNVPLGARLGVLEICTGNGVELIAPDGTPIRPDHDCPICENASVLAFGEPTVLPDPVFPFVTFAVVWERSADAHATDRRFPDTRPIRAPPVRSLT